MLLLGGPITDCVADASAPFYPDVLKCLGFKVM